MQLSLASARFDCHIESRIVAARAKRMSSSYLTMPHDDSAYIYCG